MPENLIGRVLGDRYRIDAALGAGGYGGVYRGIQLAIDRPVAIKVLHAHLADREKVRARFEREARLASRIRHSNAVGVIDFGYDEDLMYLVMELLDGSTLKEHLAVRGAIEPHEAARIGARIAAALHAAHSIGLIHRDLKPSNILMTAVEGQMQPVVIDFGLAKVFESSDQSETLTESNMMVGTPGYMSPETVTGKELDGRTDIYALGIILYELLTGDVPFRGNTPMDTATKHVLEHPTDVRERAPQPIPEDLAALTMRLLAKVPGDRPATSQEVLDELDSIARRGEGATILLPKAVDSDSRIRPEARPAAAPAPVDPTASRVPFGSSSAVGFEPTETAMPSHTLAPERGPAVADAPASHGPSSPIPSAAPLPAPPSPAVAPSAGQSRMAVFAVGAVLALLSAVVFVFLSTSVGTEPEAQDVEVNSTHEASSSSPEEFSPAESSPSPSPAESSPSPSPAESSPSPSESSPSPSAVPSPSHPILNEEQGDGAGDGDGEDAAEGEEADAAEGEGDGEGDGDGEDAAEGEERDSDSGPEDDDDERSDAMDDIDTVVLIAEPEPLEPGHLRVVVNPPHAEVWIDGDSQGAGPFAGPFEVEPGEREIEVRFQGQRQSETVEITSGQTSSVNFAFER